MAEGLGQLENTPGRFERIDMGQPFNVVVDYAHTGDSVRKVLAVLRELADRKLIIVAGSMCLFPYSLKEVRKVADEIGAWILYDAAHMGGLIAGGEFQQPLKEGADLMTGSTYKSFGGPPSRKVICSTFPGPYFI